MTETGSIDVLLSPRTALVVDIFRALRDFEHSYDVGVIDALQHRLARKSDASSARAIVSDALLLGFTMRSQRDDGTLSLAHWRMNPMGERRASEDECATLALITACGADDRALAHSAARKLCVTLNPTVSSLARDMAGRLERAGFHLAGLQVAGFHVAGFHVAGFHVAGPDRGPTRS